MDALRRDPEGCSLPPRSRALVDYVIKLARRPGSVVEKDVEPLRSVGLSDRDIHDACAVASYYCFVNRMANGLGVELEEPEAGRQPG